MNVFHYYGTLPALIFPNLVSASTSPAAAGLPRGPQRPARRGRVDGAGEWRIWWQIVLPVVRAIAGRRRDLHVRHTWNDFLWPSLMLHTRDGMTLPVGLATLQGVFSADFSSIAAGVTMTVIPILLFFIVVQRYFVRGLTGAVKG